MNYFDENLKQKKDSNFAEISLDDYNTQKLLENQSYQNYLRKESTINTDKSKHLENFFNNKIYYSALKQLSNIEKQVFFLTVFEKKTLNDICKILKISKKEAIKIRQNSINHFYQNIKLIKNKNSKGNCEDE